MRKIGVWIILCVSLSVMAQNRTVTPYYRNAVTNMMIYHPEDEFGYDVFKIFDKLPDLEKYDSHPVGLRVIDNAKVKGVSGHAGDGLHRQSYGSSLVLSASEKEANARAIERLLNEAEIGKRMVAKWFNMQGDSLQNITFSTALLEERSDYNATVSDVDKLRYTAEGVSAIRNISEDMLRHSFVLVSDMTYITAEQRAEAAKTTLNVLGAVFDALVGGNLGNRVAEVAGNIADSFMGFKVFTHSYLYQLEWNEDISNYFYSTYYTQTTNPEKVKAFLRDSTLFKVHYLGEASAVYEKTQTKGKYDRTELLELITCRSLDNNIAELQHQFADFRINTPITTVECDSKGKLIGYRALVGQKEGIRDNSTFEVLEAKLEKGRVVYSRVALIRPVKNQIWDNRFNAMMENDVDVAVEGTLFKLVGSATKQITKGMIIREI